MYGEDYIFLFIFCNNSIRNCTTNTSGWKLIIRLYVINDDLGMLLKKLQKNKKERMKFKN